MKTSRLLLALFVLVSTTALSQSRVYVAAGAIGAQDGSSWANAYSNLQTAIDASSAMDTLWVKTGTYKPTKPLGSSTDPRSKSFQLKNNVYLYGGFAGTETFFGERTVGNPTDLSGDIGMANDTSDNAYHVLVGLYTSGIIDQVAIWFGNASEAGTDLVSGYSIDKGKGGGVYLDSSGVTFNKCFINGNTAKVGGGGIYNYKSDMVILNSAIHYNNVTGIDENIGGGGGIFSVDCEVDISNTAFSNNTCSGAQGGGAIRNELSSGQLDDVQFIQNTTTDGDGGGAMYNLDSDPVLNNVVFNQNSTNKEAGAMYNDGSSAIINDATFTGNTSDNGGAMENDGGSDVILNRVFFGSNTSTGDGGAIHNWKSDIELNDVTFFSNTAVGDGGAIKNYNECSPKITNCIFQQNEAGGNGGAIYNERDSHPIITNTLITHNKAGLKGGGLHIYSGATACSPILTNVTIANNSAGISGGGAFDDGLGNSKLRNSIVHGNTAPTLADIDAPSPMLATAVFNDIIGSDYYPNGTATPTPFTSLVFVDTANYDFMLNPLGMGIDNGDSTFYAAGATPDLSAIVTDIRGADRNMGNNVDLGAYENCDFSVTPTVSLANSPAFPVLKDSLVTFTATATNQGTNPNYIWSVNGGIIGITSAPVYSLIAGVDIFTGDVVKVELHSSIPCKDATPSDSLTASIAYIGIAELDSEARDLLVYPNPNKGIFTLKAQLEANQNYQVHIYDARGTLLYETSLQSATKDFETEIELTRNLPNGLYFLSLSSQKEHKKVTRFLIY